MRHPTQHLRFGAAALTVVLLLAACAPAAAHPTPTPRPAVAQPTATPRPSAGLIPTPTVSLVIRTPTPVPANRAPTSTAMPAAAPGEKPQYGGVLTIGHFGTPPNLDLHQLNTAAALWPLGPAYNGLLQYDPHHNTEIIPDLAERWDVSKDARTFTFYLRKGVTWHDGKPFTADDVFFSFDRMRNPPKGMISPRMSLLDNITSIEKVDDHTVSFVLKEPQASFLPVAVAAGWMVIFPKHVIEAKGDMKNDVVGTGPFKLKQYQQGVAMSLVKNPDYYLKGHPYLDGITFFIIKDWNTRFAALRTRRILMTNPGTPGLTTDMRLTLEKEMPDKITTAVHTHLGFIYTVMNVSMKPFDDVRVRKAVNLGLDRKEAVQSLQQGAGLQGFMMPPGTLGALPPEEISKLPGYRQPKDQDIAEAKKLLAEAGYPNGFDTDLLNRTGATFAPRGVFMADQLKKIGIRATVHTEEDTAFYKDLFGKTFPIITYGEGEAVGDPDIYLKQYLYSKGSKNFSGFANPEIDKLIEEESRELDVTQRGKITQDIQRRLLNDFYPVAHVLHLVGQMGWWKNVRNYQAPIGLTNDNQYWDVWLAQ